MKFQVIFDSTYEQVYRLAEAFAPGASEAPMAEISLDQVPALMPEDPAWKNGAMAARAACADVSGAIPERMVEADAVMFGTPHHRSGNMCSQMRNYLDRTGAV